MYLVGVFLDNTEPSDPAPAPLDVTSADNTAVFAPVLRQVFFIGDGLTATGVVQRFDVPAGATRLFLGFADAFTFLGNPGFYNDNAGALTATFQITGGGISPVNLATLTAIFPTTGGASNSLVCDIQLNGTTFFNGDTFIANVRFQNPGATAVPAEIKIWVTLPPPDAPVMIFDVGADGSVVLIPGYDTGIVQLIPPFTITAALARGSYGLNCLALDPVSSVIRAEDLNPFTLP